MNIFLYVVVIVRQFNFARDQSRRAGLPLAPRLLNVFGMMLVMVAGMFVGLFGCAAVAKTHPNIGVALLTSGGVWFIAGMVKMVRWGKRDTALVNARIAANEASLANA